ATSDAVEAMRTRLVFAALAVGGLGGSSELLADAGMNVPRGGNVGVLAAACVLALVALRFQLLEHDLSSRAAAYALAIAGLAVIGYLAVFYFLQTSAAMLVLGTITVTLAAALSIRQLYAVASRRKQRMERLAVLGRFAAQMAHDLKNPLAALKGAVQYLKE